MEMWTEIRRKVLVEGTSKRSIRRDYRISARGAGEDPGSPPSRLDIARASSRPKPKLGQFLPVIDEILEADKTAPLKQRHTAKRIYRAACSDEYGYTGCSLQVRSRRVQGQALLQKEVFVPLSPPARPCPVRLRRGNGGDRRSWSAKVALGGDDASLLGRLLPLCLSARVHRELPGRPPSPPSTSSAVFLSAPAMTTPPSR
jgi:hypothetical protein